MKREGEFSMDDKRDDQWKISTSELRRRAEREMDARTPEPKPEHSGHVDAAELIEELRIHQIELSLQNDDLRQTQHDLEQSRNKYLDLYDFAPVGYFTVDSSMLIVEANWTFFVMLGNDRAHLIRQSLARVVNPPDQDIAYLHYHHLFEIGEPRVDELRLRRLDGELLFVSLSSVAVRDEAGEIVGARSVMSDITERKRVEQELYQERLKRAAAEQADRLKLQFLAMVSHELRTPLASIKGFASTLLAEDVSFAPAEQREFITILDQEADRLIELIGQLLDVARLQAGTLRIKPSRQSLYDVVYTDAMPRFVMVTTGHQLVIDVESDIPPLDMDGSRIAQVLVNLVDNAAKYSPAESRITLRAVERPHDVCVSVIDQGIGIPPAEREHVFDIFNQLEGQSRDGVGLGLAICKSLVEAHRGQIWIEDAAGGGTNVSFTLPLPR